MSIPNFSPKFIKARISFTYESVTHDIGDQLINKAGVPGIKWDKFDATTTVGKPVVVAMDILSSVPFKLNCKGTLNCEQTETTATLGITLNLAPEHIKQLDEAIEREGILPEYIRKFPRIPFTRKISVMPEHALIRYNLGKEEIVSVATIENLSPTGFQMVTEDPRSNCLIPSETVKVIFAPRGNTFNPIMLAGTIRRLIRSHDPVSNNARMAFGMSIAQISDDQRTSFTSLLRNVVEELKNG